MARIMIVSGAGHYGGRLALVAKVLKSRGHDVVLICEEPRQEMEFPVIIFQVIKPEYDCKPDFEWKRERDYPTLREGIRRKQIKNLRR